VDSERRTVVLMGKAACCSRDRSRIGFGKNLESRNRTRVTKERSTEVVVSQSVPEISQLNKDFKGNGGTRGKGGRIGQRNYRQIQLGV